MWALGWRDLLFGSGSAQEYSSVGPSLSISDPALAAWLGRTPGVDEVTDADALSVPAYWRAKALITGTVAGLPLKTYRKSRTGVIERVPSFLDDPAGPYARGGLTPFKWKEIIVGHLFEDGETFLEHVYNGGGGLVGLLPTHPSKVVPEWTDDADKTFKVQRKDRIVDFNTATMTQIIGFGDSTLRGESFVGAMRKAIQTSVQGDRAAAKSFRGANKVLLSTEEDVDGDDAKIIKEGLDRELADETSKLAFVNRQLKLQPFEPTRADAQFIESRQFQVEEWSRASGIPTNLMSVSGAVSNWGTGQAESNLGLQRYTLSAYTSRIEEALSRLLPKGMYVEFDFKGLLQGTPAEEIQLILAQVSAGLLTVDEGRALLGRAPLPKPKAVPTPKPIKEAV